MKMIANIIINIPCLNNKLMNFIKKKIPQKNPFYTRMEKVNLYTERNFYKEETDKFVYKSKNYYFGKEFIFLSNDFFSLSTCHHILAFLDSNNFKNFVFLDYNQSFAKGLNQVVRDEEKFYNDNTVLKDNIKFDDLFIRLELEKFFIKNMHFQYKYYKVPNEPLIFVNDYKSLTNAIDSNLSLAYYACLKHDSQIIGAHPGNNFLFEDIIINFDNDFLNNKFKEHVDLIKKNIEESIDVAPIFNDSNFKVFLQKKFYNKNISFTHTLFASSILRLLSDNNNEQVLVVGSESQLKHLEEICNSNYPLPSVKYIYRSYNIDEEKINDINNTISTEDKRVQKMLKNNKSINSKINSNSLIEKSNSIPLYHKISVDNFNKFKDNKDNYRILLQKLSILSYLLDNNFIYYWKYSSNIFLKNKSFYNNIHNIPEDLNKIIMDYFEIEDNYRTTFHNLHNLEINKILNYKGGGRNVIPSVYYSSQRYTKKIKTKFIIGYKQNLKQVQLLEFLYSNKIESIINEDVKNGASNSDDIVALKNIKNGVYTKSTLITIKNLLYRANLDLKLLKFPAFMKPDISSILIQKINRFNNITKNNLASEYDIEQAHMKSMSAKYMEIDYKTGETNYIDNLKEAKLHTLMQKDLNTGEISIDGETITQEKLDEYVQKGGKVETLDLKFDSEGNFISDDGMANNSKVAEILKMAKLSKDDIKNIIENSNKLYNEKEAMDEIKKFDEEFDME